MGLVMPVSSQLIEQAVDLLLLGKVVAFPTETVYGLGALADVDVAVERVFDMKGRSRRRPLIVHLAEARAVEAFAVDISDDAWKLAEAFWPGALTLVLRRHDAVSDLVTGGGETIAVRVPDHPVAIDLIAGVQKRRGRPSGIAAPSANKFGEPPATTAQEVIAELGAPGRSKTAPDLIVDGGACPGRVPSTILSFVGDVPRLLRRGALTPERIEDVLGRWIDR